MFVIIGLIVVCKFKVNEFVGMLFGVVLMNFSLLLEVLSGVVEVLLMIIFFGIIFEVFIY